MGGYCILKVKIWYFSNKFFIIFPAKIKTVTENKCTITLQSKIRIFKSKLSLKIIILTYIIIQMKRYLFEKVIHIYSNVNPLIIFNRNILYVNFMLFKNIFIIWFQHQEFKFKFICTLYSFTI